MTRKGPIRTLAAIAATAAATLGMSSVADAHTGAITITCPTPQTVGTVEFRWQQFPQSSTVWAEVRVDGARIHGQTHTINGAGAARVDFTVPADGRAHDVFAYTDWRADGGGKASKVASCTLPPPPVTPPPPFTTPPPTPPTTPPPPKTDCGLGTDCCPVCVTQRARTIRSSRSTRVSGRDVEPARWERVRSAYLTVILPRPEVMQANLERTGIAYDPVGRRTRVEGTRVDGRIVFRFSQAGLLAVKGQKFVATITKTTVTGKRRQEIRTWRLCMINDGDLDRPNDRLRD
jgi:hypothetical protein